MSEGSQLAVEQKIMYSQPPKEPENVVGKVTEIHETHIVVEHLGKAINSIPITLGYTIVDPKIPLTEVPTIKKITHNGTTYALDSNVSYTLRGHKEPLIGKIKKFTLNKGKIQLIITHKNKDVPIPIDQQDLKLVGAEVQSTDYPVAPVVEVPFNERQRVSYSLSGMDTKAVGEIKQIVKDRNGIIFHIKHMKDGKEIIKQMTYKNKDGIVVSNFELTDAELTDEPTKSLDGYKKGDLISFIHKKTTKQGTIIDFDLGNMPPLIKVIVPGEPKTIDIPSSQNGLQKVGTGNKKYTLKNENKYYVKYAEYKMKYLSLKK
jgi:hypothetical protein